MQNKKEKSNYTQTIIASIIVAIGITLLAVFEAYTIISNKYKPNEFQETNQIIINDEIVDTLNCPYCDEAPKFSSHSSEMSSSGMYYYVYCDHNDHEIEFNSEISMADAINKWNVFVEILNIANND